MKPAIVILGSLNMDFVVRTDHLPVAGETVLGRGFQMIPGGKGANQACAAGRLSSGALVRMVGRVGYDVFADHLKASLAAAGVDVSAVTAVRSEPTGVAFIGVDAAGQNSIIVASGANAAFPPVDVEGSRDSYRNCAFALFQLETPLPTVAAALRLAKRQGASTILDPAPAQPLPADLLSDVDILTPNESEACSLVGRSAARIGLAEAPALARSVLRMGPKAVILKVGENGCLYVDSSTEVHAPGFRVEARDTTAAGDTFNAALAVALTEGRELRDALRFANAAAAISVTRIGAQSSAPTRAEVDAFLTS
ncbi:MAG TPA: ribokinase [Bryobacteraceae bacterium]|nr:ribokinase [Bryobacteraceae bacterium]